jgi:hypothetical protein
MAGRVASEPEAISTRADIVGTNSAKVLPVEREIKIFRFD